eukprot:m.250950 g.250950  ORF g.250950 m.250950 type:complete len:177 (-) comp19534_c0_seq13:1240-1770(-)
MIFASHHLIVFFIRKLEEPVDFRWKCTEKPRDDHDAPSWLQATEFEDSEAVLMESKVKALAMILKASKETVVYTGAGISASVVGQAAKSGCNKVGLHHNAKAVNPTYTHRALALLHDHGLIQSWQQQNHDGLPQKAGYPQHKLNEIHGSWYDPGNPGMGTCFSSRGTPNHEIMNGF